MNAEVTKRFEGVEASRKALVERVRALPKEKQNARTGPKEFSPAEVVAHMMLAEKFNVTFMRKGNPNSLKGSRVKHGMFYKPTVAKLAAPDKQLPTMKWMIPQGSVDLDAVDKEWADLRQEIGGYMSQCETIDSPFVKMNFFFGTLSAGDYLALLEAHHHYHDVRFPAV